MNEKQETKLLKKKIDELTKALVNAQLKNVDIIGEKTIADAVLDRIVHHSLRVELFGESLRRKKSKPENVFL